MRKNYPILFNTSMVQSILSGKKIQTRRLLKFTKEGEAVMKCRFGEAGDLLWVRETYGKIGDKYLYKANGDTGKMKPSIFMPKAASRLWLMNEGVNLEKIQSISEEDCMAEGVRFDQDSGYYFIGDEIMEQTAYEAFKSLWISINGKDSWESDSFVWVVKFHREVQESIIKPITEKTC